MKKNILDLLGRHDSERILRLEFEARCSSVGPNFSKGIFSNTIIFMIIEYWIHPILSCMHIRDMCVFVCVIWERKPVWPVGNGSGLRDDDDDDWNILIHEFTSNIIAFANCFVPLYNSIRMHLTRFLFVGDSNFVQEAEVQPSLVIVYFGGNDAVHPHPSGLGVHVPLHEYIENMKKIYFHLRVRYASFDSFFFFEEIAHVD